MRVPPGVEGTVVDVKIFSRSGIRKDKRYKQEVEQKTDRIERDFALQFRFLSNMVVKKIISELEGQKPAAKTSTSLVKNGVFDRQKLEGLDNSALFELRTSDKSINDKVQQLFETLEIQERVLASLKEEKINKLKKGDPLPSGVIKMVKVYVAMKRTVSVGDKVAGRHGNKGVVSNIVPREDMPYLDDGTPVDIILNPLGVPSRMNVGQILETLLGLTSYEVGKRFGKLINDGGYSEVVKMLNKYYGKDLVDAYEKEHGKDGVMELGKKTAKSGLFYKTPVFDSARYNEDIVPALQDLDLPLDGSYKLRDGLTGEYLDQPVTVGVMYIMKLNHMVDDKLHARSVGPYSLVTQQPLGGKAQKGGQRLGEMEVWALEAYGAAYTLQEMLTYKSDDITGRHKVYEAIVRSEEVPDPGLPESFNVLVKELQSLGLRVDLFKKGKEEVCE